eukprot:gnl/TRDRNA2_/TRDRNA2_171413_c0_seq2.p2 gnl/TRDRNA2_/TRDRNA2_171413_c0~~gnl/TRDRNA2_/TRDRNA2_171413_c0_seq2.p2  ORF type:complete len:150 (-),score=29.05 gnl/TRDRNA2_/TRDRNA2_171413_c0_seq2:23-472(-)
MSTHLCMRTGPSAMGALVTATALLHATAVVAHVLHLPLSAVPRAAQRETAATQSKDAEEFLFALPAPLIDYQDLFYIMNVQVGTPPVDARFIFDTASSDLVVKESPAGDNGAYRVENSATAFSLNRTLQLLYGKGHTDGRDFEDLVCIG